MRSFCKFNFIIAGQIKVTQINYVSSNQLRSTANFDFGWMGKKPKHCWALSTNFSVQLIVLLDQVLLLAELARKNSKYFKIAVGEMIP